jgi:hypothetical protein
MTKSVSFAVPKSHLARVPPKAAAPQPPMAVAPASPQDIETFTGPTPNFVTTTTQGASDWFEYHLRKARVIGIFTVQEIFTAAMARWLLENNPENRHVSAMKVAEMVADMKRGTFDSLNGQTIQVAQDGLMNDGQHRSHAKLESGIDLPFLFMFGVRREARLTIDQGRPRTAADYLTMSKFSHGTKASAIATLLYLHRRRGNIKDLGGKNIDRPSTSQRADYTRANFEQIKATIDAVGQKPGMVMLGGYALIAFCHLLFAEKHAAGATEFINKLITGNDLSDTSPINTLRRRLLSERRLKREERLELIIRGWNAYRSGATPKTLLINKHIPEIAD